MANSAMETQGLPLISDKVFKRTFTDSIDDFN